MQSLLPDLRLAARALARRPWLTVAAVLCLGLGLGATAAVFSLVDAVLLRALPYDSPGRIVMVWNSSAEGNLDHLPLSGAEFLDLGEQMQSAERIGAFIPSVYGLAGEGDQAEPERLVGARVSASLFPALGAAAEVGRTFTAAEDRPGEEHEVLLSHALWQRRFGGDRGVVGRAVSLDGVPYTVVGVMPAAFFFAGPGYDVWVPIAIHLDQLPPRQARGLSVVARLKEGVTLERARAEAGAIARRFVQDHPDAYPQAGWALSLVPIRDVVVGDIRPALLALAGAVALVLLIACANVANLLLARATARAKEMAIRKALGASRGALVRQFLAESLLLALAGAALGLLLAHWGVQTFVALEPANVPRLEEVAVGGRTAVVSVLAALAAGLAFGLVPALQAARRRDLQGTLKEGGKTSGLGSARGSSGGRGRLRAALVVAEIALALVVLVGAGLVLKSFQRLTRIDPGFRRDVLAAQILLPRNKYATPELIEGFFRDLMPRLAALPGVAAAGAVSSLPLGSFQQLLDVTALGRPAAAGEARVTVNRLIVDPGYFATLGIPLLRGRGFAAADDERSVPVAAVDAGLARRLWPGEDPIGKRLALDPPEPAAPDGRTVVGVVGTVRQQSLEVPSAEQLYVPYRQSASFYMSLLVRPRPGADPAGLGAALRGAVRAIDRDQPVSQMRTMSAVLADSISRQHVNALLFGLFAAVALTLAVVGVYGVMAYSVAQRTQEIGVRMSLGARPGDVLGMVVRQGLVLAALGLGLGLAVAVAATRLLASFLYGVEPTDPATFAEVVALLLGLALLASFVPARRATRVDPVRALRAE